MADWDDDYDPFWDDNREPEPTDEQISRYEHERYQRYQRTLSPPGRIALAARGLIWHYTWRWRVKARARWLLLTGRATTESEQPPF